MSTTLISPQQSLVYGIAGAATGTIIILIFIHIILRRVARAAVWWDDGLFWLGSCLALATNALIIYATHLDLDQSSNQTSSPYSEESLQFLFARNLLRLWAVALVKASLLLFFHRLFRSNKVLRWIVYFSLCLLFIWAATFSIISIMQCSPVSYFWHQSNASGTCMTTNWIIRTAILISDASLNIITDLLCLLAPWPVLRRLQLANTKKACLAIVYLFGGSKVVVVIIRLLYQVNASSSTTSPPETSFFTILLLLEVNLAVACACLPSLTAFNSRIFFIRTQTPMNPQTNNNDDDDLVEKILSPLRLHPLAEWPILTTVTSKVSFKEDSSSTRLPSLELGDFNQERFIEDLGPDEIMVKFNVHQTVESV